MDDGGIVELFLARSEKAVDELSARYGAACLRLAENILGSRQDAEECVNDALLKVWNSVPPNEPLRLGAYVLKITRNLALNRLAYNNAAKRGQTALCLEELSACVSAARSTEAAFEEGELSALLDRFVRGLDRQNRALFIRRYWYLEPIGTIAAQAGVSEPALRARLARLRKRLRRFLKENGVEL